MLCTNRRIYDELLSEQFWQLIFVLLCCYLIVSSILIMLLACQLTYNCSTLFNSFSLGMFTIDASSVLVFDQTAISPKLLLLLSFDWWNNHISIAYYC